MATVANHVTFPQRTTRQRNPRTTRVIQHEYQHDRVVMRFDLQDKRLAQYSAGQALTLTYGYSGATSLFVGYVHHVEQAEELGKPVGLDVYGIGASWRMKDERQHSYSTDTATRVAQQLAKANRFSFLGQDSKWVYEHLSQPGISDWSFLVSLAKREGFTFYANRTELTFVRREVDLRARVVPTFVYNPIRWKQQGAVYSINQRMGEQVLGSDRRVQQAAGVSDLGQTVLASSTGDLLVKGAGVFTQQRPLFGKRIKTAVHSTAQAKHEAAAEALLHRMQHRADAVLSGDSRVHQGSTIRVQGVDPTTDGLWFVCEVEHRLAQEGYTMACLLARAELGDAAKTNRVSSSGNPLVLTDCDVSIGSTLLQPPPPVFDPVEDCVPVEALTQQPLGVPTVGATGYVGNPVRFTVRRAAKPAYDPAATKLGWRARTTLVRAR